MGWFRLSFDSDGGWFLPKTHYVPDGLCYAIESDLVARGAWVARRESCSRVWLDRGGVLFVKAPTMTFDLDGAAIEIDPVDFRWAVEKLRRRTRVAGDYRYVKLHGLHACYVFHAQQAARLAGMLEEARPEAARLAQEFESSLRSAS